MNIVPLSSESIQKLREKRAEIIKHMTQSQDGILLVLGGAFGGSSRKHPAISYAVISVFFELWDRYIFDSWSYTFDDDGLMFYIHLEEDAKALKNTMIHYEDYHPLGFAIQSHVYEDSKEISRCDLEVKGRIDAYLKEPVLDVLNTYNQDEKYLRWFIDRIETEIIKSDRNLILMNIFLYSFVSAYTKDYGFGILSPNHSGLNQQMNFEKFIHLLRTFKEEIPDVLLVNSHDKKDIEKYQDRIETGIQHSLLSQNSFHYPVYMVTITILSFLKSSGFRDITNQVKALHKNLGPKLPEKRYVLAETGFKELFNHYLPFYQKHKSVEATLLFILSRYDDYSIYEESGEKNLLKMQFLAKNLMLKEDKWQELHQFSISNGIYPHDGTILLALTIMLDLMQRNYLKIKMTIEG